MFFLYFRYIKGRTAARHRSFKKNSESGGQIAVNETEKCRQHLIWATGDEFIPNSCVDNDDWTDTLGIKF